MKPYNPRRMTRGEYKTIADHTKRDAAGALCNSAVEHSTGATVTGLSWSQACELSDTMNERELAAA